MGQKQQSQQSLFRLHRWRNWLIIEDYQDIGFAEIQRWFNVYAFDDPFFYQTSGYHGTVNPLTSYPTEECFTYNKNYFLPERIV